MMVKIPFRISWMNRDLNFLTYILVIGAEWQHCQGTLRRPNWSHDSASARKAGPYWSLAGHAVMPSCHANHLQDTKSLRRWQALDHQKTNPARNSADTLHLIWTCNLRYTDEHGVMALGCTTQVTFWHGRIGTLKPTPCRPASIPAALVVKPASVAQLKTALLEARQAQLPPINHLASLRSWGGPRA